MVTAAVTAVVVMMIGGSTLHELENQARSGQATRRQHAGQHQETARINRRTGRQEWAYRAKGSSRSSRRAADQLGGDDRTHRWTPARAGEAAAATAPSPIPPVEPWLKSSKGGHFTFTVTTG